MQTLYKYRSFDSFERALDIIVNQRLYAANFKSLNDPMEGRFVYSKGMLEQNELRTIRGEKAKYSILSASQTYLNMLMWSYYAGGHTGFAVGFEVIDSRVVNVPVNYTDSLHIDKSSIDDLPKAILSKKLNMWSHEKEMRVLLPPEKRL